MHPSPYDSMSTGLMHAHTSYVHFLYMAYILRHLGSRFGFSDLEPFLFSRPPAPCRNVWGVVPWGDSVGGDGLPAPACSAQRSVGLRPCRHLGSPGRQLGLVSAVSSCRCPAAFSSGVLARPSGRPAYTSFYLRSFARLFRSLARSPVGARSFVRSLVRSFDSWPT